MGRRTITQVYSLTHIPINSLRLKKGEANDCCRCRKYKHTYCPI